MIVTDIVELSKNRSKVCIDQEFAFVLYKGELSLYHVRIGEELAESNYRTIMEKVLPKRAKLRAMNLLQKREYTTAQLRGKLLQGFYPEEITEEALAYVAAYHYTDDLRYAMDFITSNEGRKSRRRIEMDLQQKGISKELIEQAFLEWQNKGGVQDEAAMIQDLLTKKNYDPEQTDYKERQRIYAFLLRKGFSGEEIGRAMRL